MLSLISMQSKNKISLIIFCSIFVGFLGFFVFRILSVQYQQGKTIFTPQQIHTVLQPPQGAIQATVTNLLGKVGKEGRNDTSFHSITKPTTLIEGESLSATDSGSVSVQFNNIAVLSLGTNTELDYLNGLPNALVVRQPKGTISYDTALNIKPFSIRSLGLLTQLINQTKATIVTNTTEQTVYVTVIKGTVTLAYSDQNNNTQVEKLNKGQKALFDNNASTLTLE